MTRRERLPSSTRFSLPIKNADRKAEAIRVLMEVGADPLHANKRGETVMEIADKVGVELAF